MASCEKRCEISDKFLKEKYGGINIRDAICMGNSNGSYKIEGMLSNRLIRLHSQEEPSVKPEASVVVFNGNGKVKDN